MASHDEDHAAILLRAQTHLWNHSLSFVKLASFKCIVDLGIADAIHNYGKPMPLSDLISTLQIHPSKTKSMYRLMRLMIHSGFFSQHNVTENELEVEYALTDASLLLLKNHPLSMTPFMQLGDNNLTKVWNQLSVWFKSADRTSFEMAHGMSFWEYASRVPNLNDSFNDSMERDTRLITSILTEKCKEIFTGLESLVDVGGGKGTMAKAIIKSFPHMQCIVLDLPHVVADLQGSDENIKYVGGDMFEAIPPADAILLKWILHNWNDKECTNILKKCKAAITREGKKGKVIIIDMVINDEKEDDASLETQLLFDILMMVVYNGKERNKKEWVKMISSAGFSDYKIVPIFGARSLIEIYP